MANIKSIGGNPIVLPTAGIEDGAITDSKLAQTGGVLSAISELGVEHINKFNPATITPNAYLDSNGNLAPNTSFFASDYIDVSGMVNVMLSNTHIARFYDASKAYIPNTNSWPSLNSDVTVPIPDEAKYLRFSSYNANLTDAQVGANVNRNDYVPYERYRLPYLVQDSSKFDSLNYSSNGNLYNVHNIERGYYINPANGAITPIANDSFAYSPSYVPVSAGEYICSNQRIFIAWYDAELGVISAMQMDTSKKTTVPSGASFARFSCSAIDHNAVVVMRGETAREIGAYSFTLGGLYIPDTTIVVDAGGNGDYTSFTEAIYYNIDNGRPIVVMPGTYDIKAEYVALFGQTVVDNLADSTTGINNFQYGIRLHDRTVTFMSGAHLVCDWTGKTVDGTHKFCVLRIEQNTELVGLDLECTATWYAIHDDYGPLDDSPYSVTYRNCRVIGHNLVNANCIGGGCHKYSRHVLKNCYFDNGVSGVNNLVASAAVRYHNTYVDGAEPEVYVSDCYFGTNINFTYYGTQTTKMRAYVNNCYAPNGINKVAETHDSTVDNVDIFKWNNVESA